MDGNTGKFKRDLFEIENARNLTRDELVSTFVPTKSFWRLLSAKNHIVLGSRGSGKTALAKMLSHNHLSNLNHPRAISAIKSKAFIGIYLPTSVEWVGSLKNKPWQSEEEAELFFQWRLNLSSCLALLLTLKSCLDTYIINKAERAEKEEEIASSFSTMWSEGRETFNTIRKLHGFLENVEHSKQLQLTRYRVCGKLPDNEMPVGIYFETPLFSPLKRAISIVNEKLKFPHDTAWTLCLDEAEFLSEMHHRIINSHMRIDSGNLVFKLTTMPYFHHTLDTNTGSPLSEGHDFEYVYIDRDPILLESTGRGSEHNKFARTLFNKRMEISVTKYKARGISLEDLLGRSILTDQKRQIWKTGSNMHILLEKHGNKKLLERAKNLNSSSSKFGDEIGRKISGALLLKEEVSNQKGRQELKIYSGTSTILRCGDANPRRLIRIFNNLLFKSRWKYDKKNIKIGVKPLTQKEQNRVITEFSASSLNRIQSETECGPDLHKLLISIGEYMNKKLHDYLIGSDQISSIKIDNKISKKNWKLIQRAVSLGMLYPNVSANNPDQMPIRCGVFHLAYVLSPRFRILPRRGRSAKLDTILMNKDQDSHNKQIELPFETKGDS